MIKRKILYGYQIQYGEPAIIPQEAETVRRITTLYRRGPDGKPEIDPDEAETVRLIYVRYLEGRSLGDIQRELVEKDIPTAKGIQGWSRQVIQNILTNEKYIGDGLRQKPTPLALLVIKR